MEHIVLSEIEARLRFLGKKYLNLKTQDSLARALKDGEILVAKFIILRAIDRAWFQNELSFIEAAADYKILGLSPDIAAEARQRSSQHWI